MYADTTPIDRNSLLMEANRIIRAHSEYIHGMEATEVEQKGGVLIFRGEFFFDQEGLPTFKTMAVFNMFKHLAVVLSQKYHLEE
ncbi:YciN family protein [Acerihabitans sp.]|uniref:YciN family protein n=1 Tax=Acerihabitans sp. TaxID=2811394 RepID=UPI002EDB539A